MKKLGFGGDAKNLIIIQDAYEEYSLHCNNQIIKEFGDNE